MTTWFQGWSGLKNGALLAAAESAGFDLFITADQELAYQQNMAARRLGVMVLSTNNLSVIQDRITDISVAIESMTSGSFAFVDIGHARN